MKNHPDSLSDMNFNKLIGHIEQVHTELSAQASRAINISLTIRNWLIGFYIHEYQLNGRDRAEYGKNLLSELSNELKKQKISNCGKRQLYYYLCFYQSYPQILGTLNAQLQGINLPSIIEPSNKVRSVNTLSQISPLKLINSLSYSHFEQLLRIDDTTKRAFYEVECIQGHWTVRELKRQINSLYYERSGLSLNKEKLSELAQQTAELLPPQLAIRDPYIFEFLGLKPKEVMSESHLEEQLLNHIESFLLELGHGFCFEARQKQILIGESSYFIDLVFYHRILKCHVLIELKLGVFNHENIGQLNTYVSWYKKNIMAEGDNPPIGILLCTDKDHALMEYALAGMDERLFVSKYQLALPAKEEMQKFIEEKLREEKP